MLPHRIAVLAHQGHLSLVIQGQDTHAAGVVHHLPQAVAAVGQQYLVAPHTNDAAIIDRVALQQFFR